MHKTNKTFFSFLGLVVCLMFIATIFQGCEPLRKKFTRHKAGDEDQEQYEPILDPIDYPAKVYDPKADYKYRFSLFHVWEKEFLAGIDDQTSEKRLRYFIENIIVQLQEMDKLVVEEKRAGIQKALQGFNEIGQTLKMPPQFYTPTNLKNRAAQLAKPIFSGYTPKKMEGSIKP